MYNFDDINAILAEMRDEGMVEPIDDPNVQTHFEDWAEILCIHDQVEYA